MVSYQPGDGGTAPRIKFGLMSELKLLLEHTGIEDFAPVLVGFWLISSLDHKFPLFSKLQCAAMQMTFFNGCAGEENRQELLNLGALEPLLKQIMSEDKVVRRNATMCLGTMAQNGKSCMNRKSVSHSSLRWL